jgi:hypothetical protein
MKQLLLAALLLSNMAQAATTGTLIISGTVAAVNDLSITPSVNAMSLNIISGEVSKQIGLATETSNSLSGYKIRMRSLNGSKLAHTVDNSKNTDYTISYNNGNYVNLSMSDQDVKNVSSLNGLTTQTSDIKINVVPYPNAPSGVYSDTVTISIVAN